MYRSVCSLLLELMCWKSGCCAISKEEEGHVTGIDTVLYTSLPKMHSRT